MTKQETAKVMSVIKAAYPRYYAGISESELRDALELWHMMFADTSYEIVCSAVKAYMTTNKFPPTIADIKEFVQRITMPKQIEPLEAWGLVNKALKNSLYNAKQEFYKLPDEIQKTIGSPEQLRAWAADEEGATNTVTASNFQRSYQAKIKNIREYNAMPKEVQQLIDKISETLPKLEVGNERNANYQMLPQMQKGSID